VKRKKVTRREKTVPGARGSRKGKHTGIKKRSAKVRRWRKGKKKPTCRVLKRKKSSRERSHHPVLAERKGGGPSGFRKKRHQ